MSVMNFRAPSTLASAIVLALTAACSSAPRHDNVAEAPGRSAAFAQYGVVRNIELVSTGARTSGGGAVLGAVLGAAIGNQVGSGTGRAAATGVGAVGGAVIGNQIEKRNKAEDEIYRVSVAFDNGSVAQYDYQRVDELRVGDRVRLEGGQLYRV
jgi:outer membrane lipoprotein SlyB